MATVQMSFTALPAHVRTARLVATAVARRSGVAEELLDEVRLAVGEACSRAVETHQEHCPEQPVRVALSGMDGRFEVVVTDAVTAEPQAGEAGTAGDSPDPVAAGGAQGGEDLSALGFPGLPPLRPAELGLAVISGLADDVEIARTPEGLAIRMSWPTATAS